MAKAEDQKKLREFHKLVLGHTDTKYFGKIERAALVLIPEVEQWLEELKESVKEYANNTKERKRDHSKFNPEKYGESELERAVELYTEIYVEVPRNQEKYYRHQLFIERLKDILSLYSDFLESSQEELPSYFYEGLNRFLTDSYHKLSDDEENKE